MVRHWNDKNYSRGAEHPLVLLKRLFFPCICKCILIYMYEQKHA